MNSTILESLNFQKIGINKIINGTEYIYKYIGTGYFPEVISRIENKIGKFDFVDRDNRLIKIRVFN